MIARARVVLPHPDSPASARTSPRCSVRSTPSTAVASGRSSWRTWTRRPGRSPSGRAPRGRVPRAPAPRGRRRRRERSSGRPPGRVTAPHPPAGRPPGGLSPASYSVGSWVVQSSNRFGHRGSNEHPAGMCCGSGGSPPSPEGRCRNRVSPISGNAAASACGVGVLRARGRRFSAGPSSTILPAYMIARRSETSTRTERSCVMKIIESPRSFCSDFSRRRTCACTITSSAVVGSSAITSEGLHASAIAIIIALLLAARELVRVVVDAAGLAGRPSRGARRLGPWPPSPCAWPWTMIASAIWSPTRCTGFRECMAPWKMIEAPIQRSARSLPGFSASTSLPSSRISPSIFALFGQQPKDRAGDGGLAAAGFAREPDHLTLLDVDVHAADRRHRATLGSGT